MSYARPADLQAIHTAHTAGQLTDRQRDAELALAEAMGAARYLGEMATTAAGMDAGKAAEASWLASVAVSTTEDALTPLFRLAAGV